MYRLAWTQDQKLRLLFGCIVYSVDVCCVHLLCTQTWVCACVVFYSWCVLCHVSVFVLCLLCVLHLVSVCVCPSTYVFVSVCVLTNVLMGIACLFSPVF